MKKIAATVITSLALIGAPAAFAQAAAPAAAAPAAAGAAAVDPAAMAAAKELFASMNYRALMVDSMAKMSQGLASSIRAGAEAGIDANPKATPEQKRQARAKMEAELPKVIAGMQEVMNDPSLVDEIMTQTVPLYARTFSADELKQIAAFYRTPVGAKMLSAMPQLMGEGMQIGQQIVSSRIGPMMQKLQKATQ
ncbi:hypothetical protein ASF61_18615 [Duganella sp. Leaf126]|uniref:DUF2059 domain-containing protein n=1 Tax=Duganella sp. Leaf126 TaxID=1736266 RepID=UPI0006FD6E54|nr:DUF2059 domain-containing protein [Duganella sp. Leaf126]KQQ46404.1 hypothetical protein ASF61_18615 [Duganella sp. Leaf126]